MAHRVVVWGTGNVGMAALRIVVANPALELAGVIVANPAKVGRDAGELCGLPADRRARERRRRGARSRRAPTRSPTAPRATSVPTRRSTTSSAACAPG